MNDVNVCGVIDNDRNDSGIQHVSRPIQIKPFPTSAGVSSGHLRIRLFPVLFWDICLGKVFVQQLPETSGRDHLATICMVLQKVSGMTKMSV